MSQTVGDFLVDRLYAWGVRRIFGYPGDGINGVFGALKSWNPANTASDKNPDFNNRLVVVNRTPFARGRWTHVAITYAGLGSGAGEAKLYLDGKLQGAAPKIAEPFEWDMAKGAIRLGVNYVGLMDDVAIFRRTLTAREIGALAAARNW